VCCEVYYCKREKIVMHLVSFGCVFELCDLVKYNNLTYAFSESEQTFNSICMKQ
jgi:hypothetical protein